MDKPPWLELLAQEILHNDVGVEGDGSLELPVYALFWQRRRDGRWTVALRPPRIEVQGGCNDGLRLTAPLRWRLNAVLSRFRDVHKFLLESCPPVCRGLYGHRLSLVGTPLHRPETVRLLIYLSAPEDVGVDLQVDGQSTAADE